MENSEKTLWIAAAAALLVTAGLALAGLAWHALAFLFAAAALSAAARLHHNACAAKDLEVEEAKLRARSEAEAAQERENAAREKAREDILRFHSLISHGMRIPISIIIGYGDLIRDGLVTDEEVKDEYMRKICDKAAYMNDLLAHVLLDMRFETQMSEIIKQPIDLIALLGKVSDELESIAGKSGVAIQVVSDREQLFVDGDAIGLTKAFYNIIENSLKYMGRRGAINITASVAGDEAIIVFKDDGLGLPTDEASRIFELDYQGSNRRAGNGLGLYVVKTEIQAHGGTVHAKSGPGRGMGIYITLPLRVQAAPREQKAQPARLSPPSAESKEERETIRAG